MPRFARGFGRRRGNGATSRSGARAGSRSKGEVQTLARRARISGRARSSSRILLFDGSGKWLERPAQAEIGEQLDRVADIDHDQERRPAFPGGQGAGIGLGLHARFPHGALPVGSTPYRHTAPRPGVGRSGGGAVVASLLGFQDEASTLVKIDAAGADRAVSARKYDGAFEDVKIESVVVPRRIW